MPPSNKPVVELRLSLPDLMSLFMRAVSDPKATIQGLSARLVVFVGHVRRLEARIVSLDQQIAELATAVKLVYEAATGKVPPAEAPAAGEGGEFPDEEDAEAKEMAEKVLAETEAEAGTSPATPPPAGTINRAEEAMKAAAARQGKTVNNGAEPQAPKGGAA